ncbi:hypothetical protein N8I77_007099 [Diaporthe amygdali]|uniref:Uncharacterized protein n=1 Tax=Phomopsis amygdali TaxID=1214568 RepID=A0AAD9SC72_PHOAM|nr:hypothetical protein N8I77_007099 [Diaporthe amygdali]
MIFPRKFATAFVAYLTASAQARRHHQVIARQDSTVTSTSIGNVSLPDPEMITWGTGIVGGLYRPGDTTDTAMAKVALLVMHAEQDYTTFYPCTELPARGYTTLCLKNGASKSGLMNELAFEDMMENVAAGVEYLKNLTDIDKVVIWGHSGGGAMMAAYQNIAENGASACNGAEKIYPGSSEMDGLPAADGILLIDANFGLSTMTLLSLNPAITNETAGADINETLNLYSEANGWIEDGANYTSDFYDLFVQGVAARWNRILAYAVERNTLIEAGTGDFTDDEGMVIVDSNYLGFNNKFFNQDIRYLSHTRYAWPLLYKNGTTTQAVPSVRDPSAGVPSMANSFYDGALKTTVTRFLETFAIRINEETFGYNATDILGVEWASSQTTPIGSVPGISVPLLTMGNTGHYEYLNAEKLYLAATTSDKRIAFTEGTQHIIDTCTECESYPDEYGNTVKTAFDFMDTWLSAPGRFIDA